MVRGGCLEHFSFHSVYFNMEATSRTWSWGLNLQSSGIEIAYALCWPTPHTCDGSGQGPRWVTRFSHTSVSGMPNPSRLDGANLLLGTGHFLSQETIRVSWDVHWDLTIYPFSSAAVNTSEASLG